MGNDSKFSGLKEKIDEREKVLIDNIVEQIADKVDYSLSDSFEELTDNIDNADEKVQGINEALDDLSKNVQTIGSYDFTEQFNRVKESQEALEQSAKDSKKVFDSSKEANEQFFANVSSALNEWQGLKNTLDETVEQVRSENKNVGDNLSSLRASIESLSAVDKQVTQTIRTVESKESEIVGDVSSRVSESVNVLLSEKINGSIEKLSSAMESTDARIANIINELDSISKTIRQLQNYDFIEQFDKLKQVNEKIKITSEEIRTSLNDCNETYNKLSDEFNRTLSSWTEFNKKFDSMLPQLQAENAKMIDVSTELGNKTMALTELSGKIDATLNGLDNKTLELTNKTILETVKEKSANDDKLIKEIEILKKQVKFSPVNILIAAIAGLSLILNIVSLFIK